jgi:hypothetical protein
MHGEWGRGDFVALLTQYRAPVIGFAVALGLALAGRLLRVASLGTVAAGAGAFAGWCVSLGGVWIAAPHSLPERLPLLAAGAALIGLATLRLAPRRGWLGLLATALAAGWWLAGAPRSHIALIATWPTATGVAAAVLLAGHPVLARRLGSFSVAAAGLALAASLHLAAAPAPWMTLALAAGLAGLPLVVLPGMAGLVMLPLATDIAATAAGADLTAGRLSRGGLSVIDAAAVSPLIVLWLTPALSGRLGQVGRAAAPVGAILAAAVAVGLAWAWLRFAPH